MGRREGMEGRGAEQARLGNRGDPLKERAIPPRGALCPESHSWTPRVHKSSWGTSLTAACTRRARGLSLLPPDRQLTGTKEFHFSCPRSQPQVRRSHRGLQPQPSHRRPCLRPGTGWAGEGLSTYLAPLRKKRRLLRGDASILRRCLSQGPMEAVGSAGVGRQSCFPVPLQALRIGGC